MPVRKLKRGGDDDPKNNSGSKPKARRAPKETTRRVNDGGMGAKEVVRKYDWNTARDIFMTSQPAINLKQLSLRTGIPYSYIRIRSSKERWMALRAQEQTNALKEKRKDFLRKMANEAISFDETSIDMAKLGQGIITARLVEISKLIAASGNNSDILVAKLQGGQPLNRNDLFSYVNYKELVSLAQAAQMFQQIGRTALGSEVTDGTLLNEDNTDLETVVSIGGELTKDDPARLASFVEALERAGIAALDMTGGDADEEDTEAVQVIEGSLVPPTDVKQIEGSVVPSGNPSSDASSN